MRHAHLLVVTLLGVATVAGYAGLLYLLRAQMASRGYVLSEVLFLVLLCGGMGAIYGAFAKLILRRGSQVSEAVAPAEHRK
jgi:hypothetical protein